MKFLVTFGPDSRAVDAPNAEDAWAEYCRLVPQAMKHPNLYGRKIEPVADAVVDSGAVSNELSSQGVSAMDLNEVAVDGPVVDNSSEESVAEAVSESPPETTADESVADASESSLDEGV